MNTLIFLIPICQIKNWPIMRYRLYMIHLKHKILQVHFLWALEIYINIHITLILFYLMMGISHIKSLISLNHAILTDQASLIKTENSKEPRIITSQTHLSILSQNTPEVHESLDVIEKSHIAKQNQLPTGKPITYKTLYFSTYSFKITF